MCRVVSLDRPSAREPLVDARLDSGETVRVHERRVLDLGLFAGAPLGEPARAQLDRCALEDAAERRAIRQLARRPASRTTLIGRLTGWGVEQPAAELIADRLAGLGLLDDRALAHAVVERSHARGRGRLRIQQDMARMRIDPGAAGDAIGAGDGHELARARAELVRRFGGVPSNPGLRRRAAGYLARRGFDGDVVAETLGLENVS